MESSVSGVFNLNGVMESLVTVVVNRAVDEVANRVERSAIIVVNRAINGVVNGVINGVINGVAMESSVIGVVNQAVNGIIVQRLIIGVANRAVDRVVNGVINGVAITKFSH